MQRWLIEQAQQGSVVPTLWTGVEISALLKGCLVHVLALGFELDHPALRIYCRGDAVVGEPLRAESVVQAIHAAGGLAVLAHPARYRLGPQELIQTAADLGFDGGEAWYDYDMNPTWSPSPWCVNPLPLSWRTLAFCVRVAPIAMELTLSGR